ncbi:MAG: hypothetical protein ABWZ40_02045 [Caulobacterales bacterium]
MNAASKGILATPDQDAIEERALQMLRAPAFKKQVEITHKVYLADPEAAKPGGAATLENAVQEIAFAAALVGVNTEPSHPKIGWVYNAPRKWRGRSVPGSRWGVDNPDNVYRIAPVDGASSYEVKVQRHGAGCVQFSFLIYSHFVGEDGHFGDVDKPQGGLRSDEIQWNGDGSFTLTIDPNPANGRPNHIQTAGDTKQLLIRNSMSDWSKERPLGMAIKRIGGPAAAPPEDDGALALRCAKFLDALTQINLAWKKQSLFGHWQDNVLCQPYGRGRKWGFAASGNFDLAEDEALVVTIDPLDALYIGYSLTDLWIASLDHVDQQSSLNIAQARKNADGTFTYVIAAKDPGFDNWLDTGGLRQGSMLYRWQELPSQPEKADGAVKSVAVVKLKDLDSALGGCAHFITPAERARVIERRIAEYKLRYESA